MPHIGQLTVPTRRREYINKNDMEWMNSIKHPSMEGKKKQVGCIGEKNFTELPSVHMYLRGFGLFPFP